ncbi:MAG: hypothetical protein KatS3mg062_1172 [Tepidiforma sp.]|nr:MAG: hypothetical protein KatS3mg062_1172 [Tepidiforma sp.]
MERVLVILPADAPQELAWPGAEVHRYRSPLDIPGILRGSALPVILVRDRIPPEHSGAVAEAVRAHPADVIAVGSAPWDGATPDPLAAACRGIVSGFGYGAVARLVALAAP